MCLFIMACGARPKERGGDEIKLLMTNNPRIIQLKLMIKTAETAELFPHGSTS